MNTRHHPDDHSLLSRVDWQQVGRDARAELKQRQAHSPMVSAFRWWARRPHSVMGAILDAAVDRYGDEVTVADPFSGGGTVTFEAVRRGVRAYAQDLYPWPARGLASALRTTDQNELERQGQALLAHLEPFRAAYRRADGAELSHVLRVRKARCLACEAVHHEFAHPLVSVASRVAVETRAWYGCVACGSVSLRRRDFSTFCCTSCERRWNTDTSYIGCWNCDSPNLRPYDWTPVLVQQMEKDRHGRWRSMLREVRTNDPVEAAPAHEAPAALLEAIKPGKETNRLLTHGFRRWGDLFTQRQANVLVAALSYLRNLDAGEAVRDRLVVSVLGAVEMPGYLSRWDRFHLKAFEGMANHRYTTTTFVAETNLLSPVGRGTLPNRISSTTSTLQWLIESSSSVKVVSTKPGSRGRMRTDWDVLVATGSSAKQALHDRSVGVVITDPPYFEDVQYGELSRLFHAWLKVFDPTLTFDEQQEAVRNLGRGLDTDEYEATIAACLTESRRTLVDDGTLVLTFHNRRMAAWKALAGALATAGFVVRSLAVVRSENSEDHCKRGVAAMLNDLVIECVKRKPRKKVRTKLQSKPRTLQEKNLAAMGLALSECVHHRTSGELGEVFKRKLLLLTKGRPLIA